MSNTHRTGWGTDRTMWVPGRLADYRRQFEKTARKEGEDSSIFPIALETLAVKAFGDMSHITRLRLIRDRFIAGHDSCALRRHLDSVAPETPIRDIVGCGRAMPTQRLGGLVNRDRRELYRYIHRPVIHVAPPPGFWGRILLLIRAANPPPPPPLSESPTTQAG